MKCLILIFAVLIATASANAYVIDGYQFNVQVLRSSTFNWSGVQIPYRLIKMTNIAGGYTYAQWFPPAGGKRSAVLYTVPYSGIDWSGDPVDTRWAIRPNAQQGYDYPDVEEPSYVQGGPNIRYQLVTPDQMAPNALGYLINGVGVLFVYGRYYAGGSLVNDIFDMVAGLHYLSVDTQVDKTKVGVFGASWGGMEALFASAYAPSTLKPEATVALFPPLDIGKFVNHVTTFLPNNVQSSEARGFYAGLFDSYLRRIRAGVGADYSLVNSNTLAARISKPTLVLHDSWDTLVPVSMSRDFVSLAPFKFEGMWFPHATAANYEKVPADHTFPQEGLSMTLANTFSQAFILRKLAGPNESIQILYHSQEAASYFLYIRIQQLMGQNISDLAPRLLDLCDPRITVTDFVGQNTVSVPGSYYVALVLNALWGTQLDWQTVGPYLQSNGMPL